MAVPFPTLLVHSLVFFSLPRFMNKKWGTVISFCSLAKVYAEPRAVDERRRVGRPDDHSLTAFILHQNETACELREIVVGNGRFRRRLLPCRGEKLKLWVIPGCYRLYPNPSSLSLGPTRILNTKLPTTQLPGSMTLFQQWLKRRCIKRNVNLSVNSVIFEW